MQCSRRNTAGGMEDTLNIEPLAIGDFFNLNSLSSIIKCVSFDRSTRTLTHTGKTSYTLFYLLKGMKSGVVFVSFGV